METTELRLGNRVAVGERVGYIKAIFPKTVTIKLPFSTIKMGVEDVDPIPITEELLMKMGYAKNRITWQKKGHRIFCPTDGVFVCDKNGVVLKYAHKLQNLHFEINKEELIWK